METELINTENEEYGIEYIPLKDLVVDTGIFGKKCKLCNFNPKGKGKFSNNHFKKCNRVSIKIRREIRRLNDIYKYQGDGFCERELRELTWENAWKFVNNIPLDVVLPNAPLTEL